MAVMESAASPRSVLAGKVRIAIADKNPMVRAGLVDYIARDGRFDVVGVVANGGAFIGVCEERPVDIGVIGWALPDMTGADVLNVLKRRKCGTRVIVYTGEPGQSVLRQAVKDGAWGTLIALVVGLGAAALGGLFGHNDGRDIDRASA